MMMVNILGPEKELTNPALRCVCCSFQRLLLQEWRDYGNSLTRDNKLIPFTTENEVQIATKTNE